AGAAPAAAVATTLRSDLAPIDEPGFSRAHAGPSVRKFARELGVDLARVIGQGFKGRITHEDVKSFVKSALAGGAPETARPAAPALPTVPAVDFTQFGPTAIEPLSRIQRISGPRLHASWVNVPHVTQFDLADITELEQVRAGRYAGRLLHDLEPGRHRRHGFHAHHQRAGGRDSRRVALVDAAGVPGRQLRAAPHAAAVALVRSSRHRRGDGGALHDLSRPDSR